MALKTVTDKEIEGLRRIAGDNSASSDMRTSAISRLGKLKDESSLGILEKLTRDRELGHSAIRAVAEVGSPEAIRHLTAILEEPTKDAEHFSMKGDARDALRYALQKLDDDFNPFIRGRILGSRQLIEDKRYEMSADMEARDELEDSVAKSHGKLSARMPRNYSILDGLPVIKEAKRAVIKFDIEENAAYEKASKK